MNLNKLKRDNSNFLQITSTQADSNAISESDATIAQKETRPEESARLELISGLSTCPSVRVSCPSVRVNWTGLSSVRLALGLPQSKLGVTFAYVADTSHSKLAPRMHEHAPRLTRRRL